MSRKSAVLLVAFFAMASILWADAVFAQVNFQKVGRPWEVDGVALPYIDEGSSSDHGDAVEYNTGFRRSVELRGPDTDTPRWMSVSTVTASGGISQSPTIRIFRWWLERVCVFHL